MYEHTSSDVLMRDQEHKITYNSRPTNNYVKQYARLQVLHMTKVVYKRRWTNGEKRQKTKIILGFRNKLAERKRSGNSFLP